ncbi:hypothetical protein [uncultured Azohydromonas sp.]|jgi:hypothetical protein|uniref:hypothetical protein n=1 Tax=uncultured Azohydromonas sp. TaxID=487342 RepID=UPI00260C1589|nr:hypothetical protein [uncultured Azohydromonas sp.]
MSGFDSSPNTFSFHSAFAGIPVVIEYEVEVNEDHRGRDVEIIPTVCVIGETGVDLCEDAGYFHPDQLKTWLTQAEADYNSLLADDSEPNDFADPWAASAAEDRWIAQRDQVHYARAGV